ncbi:hypothetical protein PHYPSEUDO_012220 [Phytophthora pseudosyringae]|uniref:Uncharacterized protein n=1 Tax=Phytophthora pseudosyringae TaxID=221518 RepID=A0A8T1V719_9STRA|nr:hypothetical protein PHYPSEUDO_012220 [Phytophthora pseudosyringae]
MTEAVGSALQSHNTLPPARRAPRFGDVEDKGRGLALKVDAMLLVPILIGAENSLLIMAAGHRSSSRTLPMPLVLRCKYGGSTGGLYFKPSVHMRSRQDILEKSRVALSCKWIPPSSHAMASGRKQSVSGCVSVSVEVARSRKLALLLHWTCKTLVEARLRWPIATTRLVLRLLFALPEEGCRATFISGTSHA